jgi:hypothetical protein
MNGSNAITSPAIRVLIVDDQTVARQDCAHGYMLKDISSG